MSYLYTNLSYIRRSAFLLLFNLLVFSAIAQVPAGNSLFGKIDAYNKTMPFEKLFLQTDKPYYSATDTIWFKVNTFNGLNNSYSPFSGLVYIELISATDHKVIKRISVPVKIGLSWGQLPLDEGSIESGDYILRAYTNWMQNFGEDYFFTRHLYVTNLKNQVWLINQKRNVEAVNGRQAGNIDLHLKDLDNLDYGSKSLLWTVQQNGTVLSRGSAITTADGKFKVNFDLPEKRKGPLSLFISDKGTGQKAGIPLSFNRPEDIDLQFMPEGGELLAGVRTKVGFKAIGENGLGTNVEGVVVDSKNNTVMPFKSAYKGMGMFTFAALAGETYTAKIKLADGTLKAFGLPQVKVSGISLRVINTKESDSLHVTINLSEDLVKQQAFQLIGLVNNVAYGQVDFQASKPRINIVLAKNIFPSGIVHFTVFNSQNEPVCERATFVNHNDDLKIAVTSSKGSYRTRDSISLHVSLKDKNGSPVPASSLSVLVTDNSQVKLDSLENNLVTDVLLTSGLKGNIESPAYYFSKAADAADNLDLLLLTQGWISYNWNNMLKSQFEPLFKPEPKFGLSGSVTNYTNKPLPGSKVLLMMSGKTRLITDTITDAEGKFIFKQLPKFDTVSFFVQALNHEGKKTNVRLELNEFRPAAFKLGPTAMSTPWYLNSQDDVTAQFFKNELAAEKQKFSITGNNVLKDVTVTAKKTIKNSHNLNDGGTADQVIDETAIASAGEMLLLTFLTKNVKGLFLKTTTSDHRFFIESRRVNFVVDGFDVRTLYQSGAPMLYEDLVTELNNIKIKDVTGVEVMINDSNVMSYNARLAKDPEADFGKNAYIEITTRSGKGLIVQSKQNVASYQPIPVTWPKEFYRPRYAANYIKPTTSDQRSTIFWQPHLSMSDAGNAFTSFYAADKPGIYTIIIQGADLKGKVGYITQKITITGNK